MVSGYKIKVSTDHFGLFVTKLFICKHNYLLPFVDDKGNMVDAIDHDIRKDAAKPAYEIINNRSDNYGTGENLDVIKDNGMDGHFDIHFLNSTRHKDGKEDVEHQHNVLIAAGR